MEYVYAALLLDEAGKEINESNIINVVKSAGLDPDDARAKAIVTSLKEVNIKDVIKSAQNVQMSAPVATAAPAGKTDEAEPKESEESKEKQEEEAAGGLAGLFG